MRNLHDIFANSKQNTVTIEDVESWLEMDENDPGYQLLDEDEIIRDVLASDSSESDKEEEEEPTIILLM